MSKQFVEEEEEEAEDDDEEEEKEKKKKKKKKEALLSLPTWTGDNVIVNTYVRTSDCQLARQMWNLLKNWDQFMNNICNNQQTNTEIQVLIVLPSLPRFGDSINNSNNKK